jgi:hypothetical protein
VDSCKDISKLISMGMDRELSWSERVRLRLHLLMCRNCTEFDRQIKAIRNASGAFLARYFGGGGG